jgi:hypothetical protein
MALGFVVTGSLLLAKPGLPAWLVSRALWLHGFLAIAAVAVLVGHLGHVFLTRHGRGYLSSMVKGALPEHIARDRHRTWWEEQQVDDGLSEDDGLPENDGVPVDDGPPGEGGPPLEGDASEEGDGVAPPRPPAGRGAPAGY